MADTNLPVTPGAGTNVDGRTESTNGDFRQVIVIGDPSANTGVAPVDGTLGLSVNITNASLPTSATFSGPLPAGTNQIGHVVIDGTVSLATESIEIGTVDQGTPASVANSWPTKITDGTNILGTTAHPVKTDPTGTTTQPVSIASMPSTPVTGTFWQTTQPVSGTVSVSGTVTTTGGLTDTQLRATPVPVSGTVTANTGLTQPLTDTQLRASAVPVSAASLPLPTGAATAAKQPALGTAGSSSTDVITVQGIASGTAIPVSSTAANMIVTAVGNVASGATDSGNPVKVGGVYNTTPPTLTNGQRGDLQMDASGRIAVVPSLQPDRSGSGTLGALNALVAASTQGCSTIAWIITGTWVGTISFESSIDGTNWASADAISDVTDQRVSSTTSNTKLIINCGGYSQVRMNMTAYTSGTATAAFNASAGTNFIEVFNDPAQPLYVSQTDGYKATYASSITGLTIANSATDIFTITGSATKTIRIVAVSIDGLQTTAAMETFIGLRRSTANSGGTSTSPVSVPFDSLSAAATATPRAYTANPTTGTFVGNIIATSIRLNTSGGTPGTPIVWQFGNYCGQAIVLRGTSQVFAVNFNGGTATGNVLNITVTWTEE